MKELSFDVNDRIIVWEEVNEAKLLQMKGHNWRKFTMSGEAPDYNINFVGKIAHQLPLNKKISEVKRNAR